MCGRPTPTRAASSKCTDRGGNPDRSALPVDIEPSAAESAFDVTHGRDVRFFPQCGAAVRTDVFDRTLLGGGGAGWLLFLLLDALLHLCHQALHRRAAGTGHPFAA